jgi:hypothetical protein
MSGYELPWWGKIILAPVYVTWKIKNVFKSKEKELPSKEEPKKEDVEDPRNRI